MAEHGKILSPPQFCQDVSWDPFRNWAPASRVFDREFAPPHFTDVARALGSSSWPGYARSCLSTSSAQLGLWLLKQMSNELSLVRSERGRWTVSLDINQFAPEEITIKLKEGYLEITGKHDERQDEHGFVSRCFIRRYKLPANADLEHITSYLSGDGVLSVEAPLPAPEEVVPQKIVIPVQVDKEKVEEMNTQVEDDTRREEESDPADPHPADTQPSGEEPEHAETPQQAPGVIPAEPAAEVGEETVQLGGGDVPLKQEGEIQPAEGVTEELPEQSSKDRGLEEPQAPPAQQEHLGLVDSGPSGVQEQVVEPEPVGGFQRETEGESMETPLESTGERPPEESELTPTQMEESQSPESEVPEKQDVEQAEEPSTKS